MKVCLQSVLVLVVLALPSSAGAVELVNPDGSRAEPYQTWANRSESRRIPMPSGRLTIVNTDDACSLNVSGCAIVDTRTIEIDCGGEWDYTCRHTFFHELGHMFDDFHMNDYGRATFLRRLRWSHAARWSVDESFVLAGSPSENFADFYADIAVFRKWRRYDSAVILDRAGGPYSRSNKMNRRQFNQTYRLIRWAAKENPPANQR